MDPLSLSLGILPIVVGAVKAYSSLKENLDVFRHYSREIKRMRERLNLERRLFLNETRILALTAVEDHLLVTQMLDDPDNPEWYSKTAEAAFRSVLVDSYNEYADTIKSIFETIQEMQTELACFNLFASEQQEGERLKDTIYRIRDRVKITLNKTKLEESLDELNESNGHLERLGEQVRKIKKVTSERPVVDGLNKQLPQEYADLSMVRRASKAFHGALANAWSSQANTCQRLSAGQHNVRFFLNAKVLDGVSMDLVVECPGHASSVPVSQPLRLQVKSQVMQRADTGLQSHPDSTSSTTEVGQSNRRRVHFQDEQTSRVSTVRPVEHYQPKLTKDMDVPNLLTGDLCHFLHQKCSGNSLYKCVGYLDSCCDETFRHSIYPHLSGPCNLQTVVSLDSILQNREAGKMEYLDQLNIARSLVTAVLMFYSTPWLAQYLTLRDILLFESSKDLDKCISTLHFGTSFRDIRVEDSQTTGATRDASVTGTPTQENTQDAMKTAIEDAELDHGINMTLWCLGVILWQIGHWERLEQPDNVCKVRRLFQHLDEPGNVRKNRRRLCKRTDMDLRYDELTRQCLDCDFGVGKNLTRPRLRQALYEKVYCKLVCMIDELTIADLTIDED